MRGWLKPGGMSRPARRDSNEPEIVNALACAGADVFRIDQRDLPDLLVGFRDRWYLLEVKTRAGKLSDGQERFIRMAAARRRPAEVVRTPEEALRAVGAIP